MKILVRLLPCVVLLVAVSVSEAFAGRNSPKPTDFEPLTSLPWKTPGAKLAPVLEAIFREPDPEVRYPILAEYLRIIPVGQLSQAFDLCVTLEGKQNPDALTYLFLSVWAKREPVECWKRTQQLLRLVGIEEGWLGYDSWKERPQIDVADITAIRTSSFWLTSKALLGFPRGVGESALPKKDRQRMIDDFTTRWLALCRNLFPQDPVESFAALPENLSAERWGYRSEAPGMLAAFDLPLEKLRTSVFAAHPQEIAFKIALRRWLQAEPAAGPSIVETAYKKEWPGRNGEFLHSTEISALLVIWAKADLPAVIRWTETSALEDDRVSLCAQGMLLSRVDAATRDRWLAESHNAESGKDSFADLLQAWAWWDPKVAMEAALVTKQVEIIDAVFRGTVYSPWNSLNTCHFGFGVIKDFDLRRLPPRKDGEFYENWTVVMEQWGDVDVGEAARNGFAFLERMNYVPREKLIAFFHGDDVFPSEDGAIDRAFCALRVWAVVKPREMAAWIETLPQDEMRDALAWLLLHPR